MSILFEQIYKSKKLQETLQLIDQDLIDSFDKETVEFITTPLKDLPKEYRNLLIDENQYKQFKDLDLMDLINSTVRHKGWTSFFSMNNEKPTGFFSYLVEDQHIENMKMFSLTPNKPAITLLKDLNFFIKDKIKNYDYIQWISNYTNPANRIYQKVIDSFNGKKYDEDGCFVWWIKS